MCEITNYLQRIYERCKRDLGDSDEIIQVVTKPDVKTNLDIILSRSESSKGVLTVVITSVVYKIFNPQQDIRYHQANMENGYAGRSFDSANITPFLKNKNFPAMAETGWLTRSLEQNRPYDEDYTGSIRPQSLKTAFLKTIQEIQNNEINEDVLKYIIQYLILQRNRHNIQLAKPTNLTILEITELLNNHFFSTYSSSGASRLPSLAFYAVYKCLVEELKRFDGKTLLPIENHTSADTKSGRIGDIEVIDESGRQYEALEIKHDIPITTQSVKDAYSKFSRTAVKRYYILSTVNINQEEKKDIDREIENIKRIHGCQVIVNGIIESLKYYFRLLNDSYDFIKYYLQLLEDDNSIKYEYKEKWNELN